MSDRFPSELSNDSQDSLVQNSETSTPAQIPQRSSSVKRNGSTSSHYDNINANLHARVKAFQEQRALKRTSSTGSNKRNSTDSLAGQPKQDVPTGANTSSSKNINHIVNKPLPPLPPVTATDPVHAHSSKPSPSPPPSSLPSQLASFASTSQEDLLLQKNKQQQQQQQQQTMGPPKLSSIPAYNNLKNPKASIPISLPRMEKSKNKEGRLEQGEVTVAAAAAESVTERIESGSAVTGVPAMKRSSMVIDLSTQISSVSVEDTPGPVEGGTRNPQDVVDVRTPPNELDPQKAGAHSPKVISPSQFNPIRRAPKRPPLPNVRPMQNPTIVGHAPVVQNRPKQSLSARRGLKLPPGGMSLKSLTRPTPSSKAGNAAAGGNNTHLHEFAASPVNKNHHHRPGEKRSNPGSLINGVQSLSTSSANTEQRDTEGTEPVGTIGSNGSGSGGSGSGSGGLFSNFSKYVDIKSGSLNFAGKLSLSSKGIDFSNGSSSRITLDELEFLEELGHGNYGKVSKVLHKPTNVIMAMKEVRLELDEAKFRQILMELEILHKCQSPYIVDFYGAFFIEGAVYMCMEYMDGGSLDKIYDQSPEIGGLDESHLAFIADAVIRGLRELKEVHHIIHRDVKPTNVLCSKKQGTVKLCDFGVSGNLVASMAKTNIGCQSYMAPERIKSLNPDIATYTVQSDIWSLGLSILEMALGRYPYPPETFDNIFSQLSAIVDGPPPRLPAGRFSAEAQDFVSLCLQKRPERRPTYAMLLEHPWLVRFRSVDLKMSEYITERLDKRKQILQERGEDSLPKAIPALHMGMGSV
ncbi:mitogen-activated protein kinase kinase PBS2 KNAG_0J02660 [Huiozyma naganishii CBS 8797]|uniref:mitogen-activated protein kinase kinase n=1 Tax=Huiozyma naganishii (strain ATCC MYA-139 / BCRC 22969 / CBS 8797 / KCTC 17520 / NBRC 10181 / NCYC 3082 / Yp74L-3) TaxID=1071383 RepID=J7RBS2_HUIN7|nr:hypothetical protein KNAG_0J02660 [Kazachstania naganishii CBS 8797]CCK72345.1 hypothetical protein KNAG_0J02660 [Kazachstania naganishii CBS 8797]